MAYSRKAHLRQNIEALKLAFALEKEKRQATTQERELLSSYSGFGAIKAVLNDNPLKTPADRWPQNDQTLHGDIKELFELIRDNTPNEKEFNRYVQGIRNSILTAFYTPSRIVDTFGQLLFEHHISPDRFLDPSAGVGIFPKVIDHYFDFAEITCFEKDPATGLILKHLHPTRNIRVEGYEEIESRYNGYFDIIASNIPFSDTGIFDPVFSTHTNPAMRQASRSVHNYFFVKALQSVREGGLIAFITSQGVLDSPSNQSVRELLMEQSKPVSVIRFPNNLFTDYAGTQAGSDLIILQKNTLENTVKSQKQWDFIRSEPWKGLNIPTNMLFNEKNERVIANAIRTGTDLYGKPAITYDYKVPGVDDADAIAARLHGMLDEDITANFDHRLYEAHRQRIQQQEEIPPYIPQFNLPKEQNTVVEHQAVPHPVQEPQGEGVTIFSDILDPFRQEVEDHGFPELEPSEEEDDLPDEFIPSVQDMVDYGFPEQEAQMEADDTKQAIREFLYVHGADLKNDPTDSLPLEQVDKPFRDPEKDYPFDWQATTKDWENFNDWMGERIAVTEAHSQGYNLDVTTGELTPIAEVVPPGEEKNQIHYSQRATTEPQQETVGEPPEDSRQTLELEPKAVNEGGLHLFNDTHHYHEPPVVISEETISESQTNEKVAQADNTTAQVPIDTESADHDSPSLFDTIPIVTEPTAEATTRPDDPSPQQTTSEFTGTLFEAYKDTAPQADAPEPVQREPELQQEPLLTLYDLFGFSDEERSQIKRPRRRKKAPKKKDQDQQLDLDWREQMFADPVKRETVLTQNQPDAPGLSPAEPRKGVVTPQAESPQEKSPVVLSPEQEQQRRELEGKARQEREEYFKPRPFKSDILSHYREATLVSDEHNRIGYLKNIKGFQPMFHPLELTDTQHRKASVYVEIRDTYFSLYENEATRLEENPALRDMLNRLYNDFTERFGQLNDKKNLDLIKMDARGTEILGLERFIDGVAHKADIFQRPVAFNPNEISEAENAQMALVASLNKYGEVNLPYMASLTGSAQEDIIKELDGQIYYEPSNDNYEIAAKFISGNVIEKADRVEGFIKEHPDHVPAQKSLEALRKATPQAIAFDDLDFNFGERWIPKGVYERYASWLFDVEINVRYASNIDEYSVKLNGKKTIQITDQFSVKSESRAFNGLHLMKHALQNTSPHITKKVWDGEQWVKVADGQAIQLANSKIDEIRNGFCEWLREQSPEFKDRLAEMYNRKFNCFVRPKYDGSHQEFPGLDLKGLGIPDLYTSQKDAVWMDKLIGGGIIDHEVGGGKSIIMCVSAMEKKRLGLVNKPLIIGLKANIHEIARTFCTAYPNARVLYPGKEDFTPANRKKVFNAIKNNDWDAVILTHEQFGKIPQSPELQREILQAELDSVEENLRVMEEVEGKNASRMQLKGCLKRKSNLEAKLKTVMYQIETRKDDEVDFKRMGIDHLYVDESHKFKNLTFTTRHDRVAGLGDPDGSQRALNMLFAIRTIQDRTGRDLGATFLSGTTISNSLTELYLLFKYLRPKELERQGINTFDAWAAIFAKKTIDYEFSITNEVVQKERFRYFIKVPELAAFYSEITDYRTADDIGIDRPKKNEILYNIPPTPDQVEFTKRLVEFARSGQGELLYRGPLNKREEKAKMLIATDYARKMSLDMRMVDRKRFGDHVDNKATHCAHKIAEYYHRFDEHKGTQFVFSDLGTYKPDEWNIYTEVKRKLVEDHGIPASEIRFIQEATSERLRKEMISDMNSGKIRVLFGSTEMLGTGVNAQKRCVAIHHLDSPWRPSDLEQRDGRGIRTGNEIAKLYAENTVDVLLYAVERTLDAYKFGLLHNKQLFIRQLKSNNSASRTIDEGALDEQSGMNFSEYVAILSGNTDLLEKARIDKKITTLESERQAFMRGKSSSRYKLDGLLKDIENNDDKIVRISKDLENFKSRVEINEEGGYKNPIQLDGVDGKSAELIGKHLNHLAKTVRTGEDFVKIGTLYGFELLVKSETTRKEGLDVVQNRFYVRGEGEYLYKYNNGIIASDPRTAAQNFINALGTIEATLEHFVKENEKKSVDIPKLREVVESTWRKEPELAELKSELRQIEAKINQTLKPIANTEGAPQDDNSQKTSESHGQPGPGEKPHGPEVPAILRDIPNRSDGRIVIAGIGGNRNDKGFKL